MYVLYLESDASDLVVQQFKADGKVSLIYFDSVNIYTLDYFEMLFNSEEISNLGLIKFADEKLADYYLGRYSKSLNGRYSKSLNE